jgi:hypothetical protein
MAIMPHPDWLSKLLAWPARRRYMTQFGNGMRHKLVITPIGAITDAGHRTRS